MTAETEAVLYAMRLLRESNPSPAALAEVERIEAEWKSRQTAEHSSDEGGEGLSGCNGSPKCRASLHEHGCFADNGDCTDPSDHIPALADLYAATLARTQSAEAERDDLRGRLAAVEAERDNALHRLSEARAERDEWQDAYLANPSAAQGEGEVAARVLREAADALDDHTDCDCEEGDHLKRLATPSWLRARADSLATPAPETDQ